MTGNDDEPQKAGSLKGSSLRFTINFARRKIWREIALEFGGDFKAKQAVNRNIEAHHLSIPHDGHTIHFTISDKRPLKCHIYFHPLIEYNFTISREGMVDRIMKKLGKRELQVGYGRFDRHYFIKTSRTDITKNLLSLDIQKLMLKHNLYSISYQSDCDANESELQSHIQRKIRDKKNIRELIALFKSITDKLVRLDVVE